MHRLGIAAALATLAAPAPCAAYDCMQVGDQVDLGDALALCDVLAAAAPEADQVLRVRVVRVYRGTVEPTAEVVIPFSGENPREEVVAGRRYVLSLARRSAAHYVLPTCGILSEISDDADLARLEQNLHLAPPPPPAHGGCAHCEVSLGSTRSDLIAVMLTVALFGLAARRYTSRSASRRTSARRSGRSASQ